MYVKDDSLHIALSRCTSHGTALGVLGHVYKRLKRGRGGQRLSTNHTINQSSPLVLFDRNVLFMIILPISLRAQTQFYYLSATSPHGSNDSLLGCSHYFSGCSC